MVTVQRIAVIRHRVARVPQSLSVPVFAAPNPIGIEAGSQGR